MNRAITSLLTLLLLWSPFVPKAGSQDFSRKSPGDENWDTRFLFPLINGTVRTIVADGDYLYIGGSFTEAGGVSVNSIVRWDGTTWDPMDGGTTFTYAKKDDGEEIYPGEVNSIVVNGGKVYVGGQFSHAGAVATMSVAMWDGNGWSGMNGGLSLEEEMDMPGTVVALLMKGDSLYAGGEFIRAGETLMKSLARWDGNEWLTVGGGVLYFDGEDAIHGEVYSLAADGEYLYVGGNFNRVGEVSAGAIARWNGSEWSSMANGVNGLVHSLAVEGGELFAGGSFSQAGAISAFNIARWDNIAKSWHPLGAGLNNGVYAITSTSGYIYAGGMFTAGGGLSSNRIAMWSIDDGEWQGMASGFNSAVRAICIDDDRVFVGGDFTSNNPGQPHYIALWRDGDWRSMAAGVDNFVHGFLNLGDKIVVIGTFTRAGDKALYSLAGYDIQTGEWSAIGTPLNDVAMAAIIWRSELYVGGSFTTAGGVTVNRIARWDGSQWHALGEGISGAGFMGMTSVSSLASDEDFLYVGGAFSEAGGSPVKNIARWNGTEWSSPGTGVEGMAMSLARTGNKLYVGGMISSAGGETAANIACWNGSEWSSPGGGVNGAVSVVVADGDIIYAGGQFTQAGAVPAAGIARWNGTAWEALGSGLTGGFAGCRDIALSGEGLFAGGDFEMAGGAPANSVAWWNGTLWEPVAISVSGGPGLTKGVYALLNAGNGIYFGGTFSHTGSHSIPYFGRWMIPAVPGVQTKGLAFDDAGETFMDIVWKNGDGRARAIFVREGESGAAEPENNTTYTASAFFGGGDQIGSSGWYCVYNGTGSSMRVTGLSVGSTYHVVVFEFNGFEGDEKYNLRVNDENSTAILITSAREYQTERQNLINITPNPFSGHFAVSSKFPISSISLFSTAGTLLNSHKFNGETMLTLPSDNLLPGLYLLRVTGVNGESVTEMVIKK